MTFFMNLQSQIKDYVITALMVFLTDRIRNGTSTHPLQCTTDRMIAVFECAQLKMWLWSPLVDTWSTTFKYCTVS